MLFDFAAIESSIRYKLLSATVTPRPIAWVTTLADDGHLNAAPFSFFNVFGEDPPIVGISILSRTLEDLKDTGRNIRIRGEFVVNLVSEETLDAMSVTAIDFPPGVDEVAEAGLRSAASARIATPRIAESRVSLECRLMRIIELGPMRSLIFGEVLAMHVADASVIDAERGHVDTPSLRIIGRAGANSYVTTDKPILKPVVPVAEWQRRT